MIDDVVLKAENITKNFPGTRALNDVSIELKKGEIHAVVGENGAGKSTLMSIISGALEADSGKIFIEGKEVHFENPKEAQQCGIGMVHQEFALCPDVSVSDNIFIERLPSAAGIVNRKELHKKTAEILGPFDTRIQPEQKVLDLSMAQQQIVEIAKAVSLKSKVIIFDEPTSSLNENETVLLLKLIQTIADKGIGVFYISHKLTEIFQICDRITVLRDGNNITTTNAKETTVEGIISKMVGRNIGSFYPSKSTEVDGEELLRVENFSRLYKFKNISFNLRKGEILGLCGLVGAGRTEIARAICGIDPYESGTVFLEGEKIKIRNYSNALKVGVCYLSEDRRQDGLFLNMSISDNMIAPQVDKIASNGLLADRILTRITLEYKEKLNIKFTAPKQKLNNLSGGNQQKIMIAKLLALQPKVIILDEPTRGIDVGSKSEIHNILRDLCNQGIGIIVISSEMPEIVGICDRVIILNEGEVIGSVKGYEITQDKIISKISERDNR